MEKRKVGKPTKYKPEYCEKLIHHMKEGMSFESFGGAVGVSKQTLYDWTEAHEEFQAAKEIGLEYSRVFWEKLGINHIVSKTDSESEFQSGGFSKSRSLNSAAWIFNMKNRFGWRDRQPDEVDNININNYSNLSDDDLKKKIEEKLKKSK